MIVVAADTSPINYLMLGRTTMQQRQYLIFQNNTDSNADLMLYHWSQNYGTVWVSGNNIAPGDKTGPLKCYLGH